MRLGSPHALLVVALVVLGLALRLHGIGAGTLFIDEAESSLNGLSILEHGMPTDRYLGLPMYENTLTEPWPENEEYEFRDTSYSSQGMGIYHGWLPLYAIALSQALHGVHPDAVRHPPRVQHDDAEILLRIRAARLPAAWFGALFLVAMYAAGRCLYGRDAGLVALLAAGLSPKCVWLAQQARYYSASLALSALFVAALWQAARRGRTRDCLAAAGVLVLLFHTHSLACALALLPALLLLPTLLRHPAGLYKLVLSAGVFAAGTLPWLLWSGFLEHVGRVPMAHETLAFADYFVYLRERAGRAGVGLVLLAAFVVLWMVRGRFPARLRDPVASAAQPVLFLATATLTAYFGFQWLAPAASCSMARLSHLLVVPPLLLAAIGVAGAARAVSPRHGAATAVVFALGLLLAQGGVFRRQERNAAEAAAVSELIAHLRQMDLAPDARVYALPYQHFVLTYLTGLPVQSIAPVRPEFLATYAGEVVILETATRFPRPRPDCVVRAAARAGFTLGLEEAEGAGAQIQAEAIRSELSFAAEVVPEAADVPAWVAATLEHLPDELAAVGQGRIDYASDNPALFRGLPPLTLAEFWIHFFYRFVDPEQRSGPRLNYLSRARTAQATLLPSGWVVLRCPPPAGAGGA